jgi:hypothetical protein
VLSRLGGGILAMWGLLFRLAELLIVILPLAGTIIAAIKAFSAQTSGEVSNPAIRFKQDSKTTTSGLPCQLDAPPATKPLKGQSMIDKVRMERSR